MEFVTDALVWMVVLVFGVSWLTCALIESKGKWLTETYLRKSWTQWHIAVFIRRAFGRS